MGRKRGIVVAVILCLTVAMAGCSNWFKVQLTADANGMFELDGIQYQPIDSTGWNPKGLEEDLSGYDIVDEKYGFRGSLSLLEEDPDRDLLWMSGRQTDLPHARIEGFYSNTAKINFEKMPLPDEKTVQRLSFHEGSSQEAKEEDEWRIDGSGIGGDMRKQAAHSITDEAFIKRFYEELYAVENIYLRADGEPGSFELEEIDKTLGQIVGYSKQYPMLVACEMVAYIVDDRYYIKRYDRRRDVSEDSGDARVYTKMPTDLMEELLGIR